ncbi:MAG: oxalate/formate MFS antiporter [Gemmataceae bacterium]|nr:oxalate/formate MFS antiporter [Gemmataceae bacterium]
MMAVANFQYGWTLFVLPLEARHGWSREAIQVAFSLFLLTQTVLLPGEAYLADRFGPRLLLVASGIFVGLAWCLNSMALTLPVLYAAQLLSGCGSGIVYGISMGNALKWFPDRRGLAAGMTAAAFGAGSALTVLPIEWTIDNAGYESAFLWFGLGQAFVVTLAGLLMRFPYPGEVPAPAKGKGAPSALDLTPVEVLRTPAFWLLFLMMTVGAVPGLLMTGQMGPMATDFGVARVPVTLLGITAAALPFALMLDRILGGFTRPIFGWLSDQIGREVAMFLAFALEGGALLVLLHFAHDPVIFVVMSGIAFFGWGAIFSLFPAATGDFFGRKYATTNYGLLYTAKGLASLLLLWANHLREQTGSWDPVFVLMVASDWTAALLALFALRPLHRRWTARAIRNAESG